MFIWTFCFKINVIELCSCNRFHRTDQCERPLRSLTVCMVMRIHFLLYFFKILISNRKKDLSFYNYSGVNNKVGAKNTVSRWDDIYDYSE